MFDEPINSIYQAKEYFKSMGCSHFHMSREFPQRYAEYKKLNIPGQKEKEWEIEQLNEYYNCVVENNTSVSLWIIHSKMADLTETLKTDDTLIRMLEVTKLIRDRIPVKDRVIVAETINGRSYSKSRSGLIYLAYDLNNFRCAKDFVELSLYFSTYEEEKSRDFDRCQRSAKLCLDIIRELKL